MSASEPRTPSPSRHPDPHANTIWRTRFFTAINNRGPGTNLSDIYKKMDVPERTGRYWLRQQKIMESPAFQRQSKARGGRHHKIPDSSLDQLLDADKDTRSQNPENQISCFGLNCCVRTLKRSMKDRKNARRYLKAKVRLVSNKNKEERVKYGDRHKGKGIEDFWCDVHFTDEAHIDPSAVFNQTILRVEGTQYEPENLQEVPKSEGVKLHVAASVSWNHKGPIKFYHDPEDPPPVKVKKSGKPRLKTGETPEQLQFRVERWEASKADFEVKPKGNSMTQKYYTENILPHYLKSIEESRAHGRKPILQEDNDPSHGTRSSNNLAARFKREHNLDSFIHPAQSPDLNPIEACWNILKQRLKRENWENIEQLMCLIIQLWDDITLEEIRARIREMPKRCEDLVDRNGQGVKSSLW